MTLLANLGSTVKAYWWVFAAMGLLVAGYMFASHRMRVKALRMQVEALQALRDAKARRKVRDAAIDAGAEAEDVVIVEKRDATLKVLDTKAEELDATRADHDRLDVLDDEVNAFLRDSRGEKGP